ncbi:MAG TPA: hypothetical protein VL832_17755 [Puia sp.]|nr:hypothetical protein [Puia sp.]
MVQLMIRISLWAGMLMGIGFAPPAPDFRVVVTDYGAVPDSRKDAVPAIRRALAACRGHSPAVLVFPRGRYDLYPDSAEKKEYFLSNTSSESECPSKWKTVGVLLEGMQGLRIEGEGSLLMYHGRMITFALDHCEHIELRHLEVDFERPTMSEFTILQSTPSMVDVQVHPDSWYKLDSGRLVWYGEGWQAQHAHCIRVDTVTGAMYYAGDEYDGLMRGAVTETTPFRLRFHGSFDTTHYLPGNVFTVRDPIRDEVGALIAYSKDIKLQQVGMHYMHGLGILSQYSENLTMDSVVVEPRSGSGRRIASFADGMHFSGCRGRILIEHCRFKGLHDDAINVHGTHLKIVKRPSADQLIVRFMHPQTYGFEAYFPGDSIVFVHPETLVSYGYGVVRHVKRLSDREILLTLNAARDRGTIRPDTVTGRQAGAAIPPAVLSGAGLAPQVGDVVENLTWTPQLTVRNNQFTGTNTRGLLVTTRRKVVIEANEFNRLGMQAILIADDALSWYESGPVRDVLIRNNVIRECGHNALPDNYAIAIAPENHQLTAIPVHRNIRIEGNRFYCYQEPVLTARSVEGLSFTNNTITYGLPFAGVVVGPAPDKAAPRFRLVACKQVNVRGNYIIGGPAYSALKLSTGLALAARIL